MSIYFKTKYDPYKQAFAGSEFITKQWPIGSELLKNHKTWLLFIVLLPLGLTYSSPWTSWPEAKSTRRRRDQETDKTTLFFTFTIKKNTHSHPAPTWSFLSLLWMISWEWATPPHITKNLLFWPERRPCRSDSSPHHHHHMMTRHHMMIRYKI